MVNDFHVQNKEKAAKLVIANEELAFQAGEKADRAAELVSANKELTLQNEEVLYLSHHDQLTAFYNRRFYEIELKRLEATKELPLTLLMGDVNGLKLINDSFGHAMGDALLKKTAEIIKKGCRYKDIIFRTGGDEFVILLPNTDAFEAERIIKRITELSLLEKVGLIDISISFGYEIKNNEEDKIQDVFKRAEEHMYNNKLFESLSARKKTVDLIIKTLHEKTKSWKNTPNEFQNYAKEWEKFLGCLTIKLRNLKQ